MILSMCKRCVPLPFLSVVLLIFHFRNGSSFLHPSSYKSRGITTQLKYSQQRDVYAMEAWAIENGYQKVDGVELYSEGDDDWSMMTNTDIPAGTTIMFIPSNLVLSSDAVVKEYGSNFDLELTENALKQMERDLAKRLPLFRLLVKILAEYEKGENSFYAPWINSLPTQYYNGVSMTGKFQKSNLLQYFFTTASYDKTQFFPMNRCLFCMSTTLCSTTLDERAECVLPLFECRSKRVSFIESGCNQ